MRLIRLTPSKLSSLLEAAINSAVIAGEAVLKLYSEEFQVSSKLDGSPLTKADLISHQLIVDALLGQGFPIVSEEGAEFEVKSKYYWLVDPLDGTKDFLAKNHEFTVNIALVENDRPIMGVVYAPALSELYCGSIISPAIKRVNGLITSCKLAPRRLGTIMAKSRFHHTKESEEFANNNHIDQFTAIGASLKYCRLAFAEIDVYPRLVGTSEWDTAAGQSILESAGGCVIDLKTKESLVYGKPRRRNGNFIAFRAPYNLTDFKL